MLQSTTQRVETEEGHGMYLADSIDLLFNIFFYLWVVGSTYLFVPFCNVPGVWKKCTQEILNTICFFYRSAVIFIRHAYKSKRSLW